MDNYTSYRVNINPIFTENLWEGECKNTKDDKSEFIKSMLQGWSTLPVTE